MLFRAIAAAAIAAAALVCAFGALSAARERRIAERDELISGTLDEKGLGEGRHIDGSRQGRSSSRLHEAGIEMSSAMWLVARFAVAFIAFSFANAFGAGPFGGLAAAGAVFVLARFWMAGRLKRRRLELEEQFGRACSQIAASVRAGLSVERAIRSTAAFVDEPLKEEFVRVGAETRHDPDVAAALRRMAERTGNRDVAYLASAVDLNQRRGGRLADMIDRLAETVETRQEMRRLVRSESASGRSGAKAVVGITVLLVAFQLASDPANLEFYTTDPRGWVIAAASIALMVVGCLWVRRIIGIRMD